MRVFKPLFILPLSLFLLTALNSSAMAAATETKAKAPAKIDLNSATEEQLKELPGIGDVSAKKIVSNRPYKSVDELSKAGLSENQIAKISSQVTVKKSALRTGVEKRKAAAAAKSSGKVDLNTASSAELEALPGVGPAFAKKIVDNRPYASVAELKKAGLPEATFEKLQPMVKASKTSARSNSASRKKSQPVETSATPKSAPKASSSKPAAVPEKAPAAAGGSDRVWLNTDSNIYHRSGDYWYGKTKSGKFVTEEEAKALGARESGQ